MQIGQRLKTLREEKNFSQGDIEKATGLLRCYVSRVENGHTVPTVETLEKWPRALAMPLSKAMNEGTEPSDLSQWQRSLAKMDAKQRPLLLGFAARLARHAAK